MKKFFKIIIFTVFGAVALFLIFLATMIFLDFKLPKEKIIAQNNCVELKNDTLSILSWNIGYAGLDATMDFFYEGGTKMRQDKNRTHENLRKICNFLQANADNDFIILQEVDEKSLRSHHLHEFDTIAATLSKTESYFAINYDVLFVPLPVTHPTGRIKSGLTFHSVHTPLSVTQYAYPNNEDLPKRAFLYDKCFVAARYKLQNGHQLLIINTHNSAYDDGEMRTQEMNVLKNFIVEEYKNGNYIVVGGDWNQNPPQYTKAPANVNNFNPIKIPADFMPAGWTWNVDLSAPTNRYVNKAYDAQTSATTTLDFFLASPNVEFIKTEVVDLQFANSDHNPVCGIFYLK